MEDVESSLAPSRQPPVWYQVLRAALLPLLALLLAAGLYACVCVVQMWIYLESRPPEGWGAGFVVMGLILFSILSLVITLGSVYILWLMWSPSARRRSRWPL